MKHYAAMGLFGFLMTCASQGYAETTNYFDGIYAGVRAGAAFKNADIDVSQTAVARDALNHDNSFSINASPSDDAKGLNGGFFLGYGQVRGIFYLGGEVFANYNNQHLEVGQSSFQAFPNNLNMQVNSTFIIQNSILEYGADLRPGLLITPKTLVYGRAGLALTNLTLTNNSMLTVFNTVPAVPVPVTTNLVTSNDRLAYGLRLGLGVQQYVGQDISLSADYIYTAYSCVNTNAVTNTREVFQAPVTPNTFTSNTRACLSSNVLTLGVNFYFH